MNTVAAVMLFLWVAGWVFASIRACLKTRFLTGPCTCRTEFRTGFTHN